MISSSSEQSSSATLFTVPLATVWGISPAGNSSGTTTLYPISGQPRHLPPVFRQPYQPPCCFLQQRLRHPGRYSRCQSQIRRSPHPELTRWPSRMLPRVRIGQQLAAPYERRRNPPAPQRVDRIENSQCRIPAVGSTFELVLGNQLDLTLNITYKPAFSGLRLIYGGAQTPTANSGWQMIGFLSVP